MKREPVINKWSMLLFLMLPFFFSETSHALAKEGQVLSRTYAGFSEVNITPVDGYAHYRGLSTGVHDSLYVKAVVFGKGDQRLVLVVCDLLWIERELSSRVRVQLAEEYNIPHENVILSATHTHNSPSYHDNISVLNETNRPTTYQEPLTEKGKSYFDWLVERIVFGVTLADKSSRTVYFQSGCQFVENLAFNRRSVMADGTVRTNAGAGNPNIVRPAGPADPEMEVVLVRDVKDNKVVGCLTAFGLHADTFGGTKFSGDFPAVLSDSLKRVFGPDFVSIFIQGASGDINHVDVGSKLRQRPSTLQIGTRLASAVLSGMAGLKNDRGPIKGKAAFVYVPLQSYTQKELTWATCNEDDSLYNESPFLTRRRAVKIRSLHRMRQMAEAIPPTVVSEPWTLPLQVQVFRIGDSTAIVGLPGELFSEIGIRIKEQSPFPVTLVVSLTNSHIAYVPTHRAFAEGGYEAINSRLSPGGGEILAETAIRLLSEQRDSDKIPNGHIR